MEEIINTALAEVGTKEEPRYSNKTKYGEWFGLNGVPWCAIFVSWVYDNAGFNLGHIGFNKGFAGCQTAVNHFKQTGEITTNPQPGDIVFYDWNNDGRYDHTGIYLEKIDDTSFYAIEGNTAIGNNSNGGEVMKRKRYNSVSIFVHPKVLDK